MFEYLLNYIANNPIHFWVFIAVSLCILEIILGFPIAFFIAGISAIFTALVVIVFPVYASNAFIQICIFLTGIPIGFFLLLKNIKILLFKTGNYNYLNILNQPATIYGKTLIKGEIGKIKWSGTIVKAQIAAKAKVNKIDVNEKVYILEIKENIFIVDIMLH